MYLVFAMFKLSLLRESYFLTFLRSTLALFSASPSVLPTAISTVADRGHARTKSEITPR